MCQAILEVIYQEAPGVPTLKREGRGRPGSDPFNVSAFCRAMWGKADKTRWDAIKSNPEGITFSEVLRLSEVLKKNPEDTFFDFIAKARSVAKEIEKRQPPKKLPVSA